MLGPVLTPSLADFIEQPLLTREGGWLDHVLGWWAIRARDNVLLLTYEHLLERPSEAVRRLAPFCRTTLSEEEVSRITERMSLKWSLEHVDPYLHRAITPFSPPDRIQATRSGFIVNTSALPAWAERMSAAQRAKIRADLHSKIRSLIDGTGATAAGAGPDADDDARQNAASFFHHQRHYFCADGVVC